jgi:signal peptide peptidase SppA
MQTQTPAELSFREQLAKRVQRPSLLDPHSLESVLSAPFQAASGQGPKAQFGGEPGAYTLSGGVATVAVMGPLAQRAWECWMFAGDGYDAIVSRVESALADQSVSSLVLLIDSPGGEVAGCFEAVRAIRAASAKSNKPIVAYADELAASAAYALACACESIVLPDTGMVGSVGVITSRVESNSTGDKVHIITSGARKADGHPQTAMTEEEIASTQAQIDYLAGVFAAEVAQARGMSAKDVLALEAGVFLGPQAIKAGLADEIGNYSTAVARARSLAQTQRKKKQMKAILGALGLSEDSSEEIAVATIDGLKAKAASADVLQAEAEQTRAAKAQSDVAAALEAGDKKGCWTPATRGLYAGKSAEEIRAFVAVAPRVIPAATVEPKGTAITSGKRWEDMAPIERAALHNSDPTTYTALREDAAKRGAL